MDVYNVIKLLQPSQQALLYSHQRWWLAGRSSPCARELWREDLRGLCVHSSADVKGREYA